MTLYFPQSIATTILCTYTLYVYIQCSCSHCNGNHYAKENLYNIQEFDEAGHKNEGVGVYISS